jgi:hypothetical protein
MGDFNKTYEDIKDEFDLQLASGGIKTCSLTPICRLFWRRDVDHILSRGFKIKNCGFLEGASDHRLIYTDLF